VPTLVAAGQLIVACREPGRNMIGQRIRQIRIEVNASSLGDCDNAALAASQRQLASVFGGRARNRPLLNSVKSRRSERRAESFQTYSMRASIS
jgi:hypothetical protein